MQGFVRFAAATLQICLGMLIASIAILLIVGIGWVLEQQTTLVGTLSISLAIAVATNILAATLATLMQRYFARQSESSGGTMDYGSVFERYVGKFAWLVGAISAGYGGARILDLLLK